MARSFVAASSQYLEISSAIVTVEPLTMVCWFYSDSVTLGQNLVSLQDKDVDDVWWRIIALGDTAGDPIRAQHRDGGAAASADTSTGYSANTWHHACGVFASTSSRSAYIDGGSKGIDSSSKITPPNIDSCSIGRVGDLTPGQYTSGRIAEAAIWNVALTDAEVALLARGYAPPLVRPEALRAYWPLLDNDTDYKGGFHMTPFNSPTFVPHPPRIIYQLPKVEDENTFPMVPSTVVRAGRLMPRLGGP